MSLHTEPSTVFPTNSFLSDFIAESTDIENDDGSKTGQATIRFSGQYSGYEMIVNMKNGKKEGLGVILSDNGTTFLKLMFRDDLAEGKVLKKDKFGRTVMQGELRHGVEHGLFEEFNEKGEVIWRGFYRNGRRYSVLMEKEGMKGFYYEVSMSGELLSVSQYDSQLKIKQGSVYKRHSLV